MTTEQIAALFATCQRAESLGVMNVHGDACDNAAATMGAEFTQGSFGAEFLGHWFGSLQSILSDSEDVSPGARKFFDFHKVPY